MGMTFPAQIFLLLSFSGIVVAPRGSNYRPGVPLWWTLYKNTKEMVPPCPKEQVLCHLPSSCSLTTPLHAHPWGETWLVDMKSDNWMSTKHNFLFKMPACLSNCLFCISSQATWVYFLTTNPNSAPWYIPFLFCYVCGMDAESDYNILWEEVNVQYK